MHMHLSKLIPGPRAIRWDYRSGTHYWLTQWKAWIFAAITLLLAVLDLAVDGVPLDHSWTMWVIWFVSGLTGTFLPFLTWHRWVGPLIAERNARRAEVQAQLDALNERLATDQDLAPWERRRLELDVETHRFELDQVSARRTMIPRPS